jgi:hypothetical protein
MIVGVPISSWEWASPFMAQPPYTRTDLTARVRIITPWRLHCCRAQWLDYTRDTLRQWSASPSPTPVVALFFDARTGGMSRLTDQDEPALRSIVPVLMEIDSVDAMDRAILGLLQDLVATRPAR